MGYWVVRIQGKRARPEAAWHQRLARGYFSFLFHRVNAKSLAIWYRSFSNLLEAGMNMHEAALALAERTRSHTLRQVTRQIAEAARRGEPMSPVLDRYPSAFPLFAKALVETGEETGLLNETLERLAQFYDSIFELQMAFRLETFYPKVVLFMFIVIPPIIPAVAGSAQAGGLVFDWHVYLRALLGSVQYWVAGLLALWFGWRFLMQIPPVRAGWDRVKLLIPWIGGIVRRVSLVRWARAMAMLLRAGVPLRRALEAAASATGNEAMARSMRRELSRVITGEPLSVVMTHAREFPEQAIDMVMTGERSGNIDRMLDKMAEYYHTEATVSSRQTAIVAGVVFYLAVAVLVGSFVISFYLGYFKNVFSILDF
jgi:type IV pilus assembly protein PilC